ncbi:hypothetical protein [Bradyrhizobium erythrophlei]|uniref:Uncharacterized protein n=1 Tax=Bradyrhizobium erythrophlei TaxID=1437360 RepID=A0A1M5NMP7_9BRAD|nr:hypothetical protein [Bradyrhizobium erythrophlei]SHG90831.1 hypothetical protein SAMN05443248_3055 [Bradyrhizobium erythrophlei]
MLTAQEAAELSRQLVDGEVLLQTKMWGETNDRADISQGQLMGAALAQIYAVGITEFSDTRESAFDQAEMEFFPADWGGFRDYGSDIANLVVAAAYLRNEIKRRLMNGESSHRAPRRADQVFDGSCVPNPIA